MSAILFWLTLGGLLGYTLGKNKGKKRETADIDNIGELIVIKTLKKHFPKSYNYLLNNVTLPISDNGTTQIDHILINEYGIFVIETKHYSGWIFGKEDDPKWTQTFSQEKKFSFLNPLKQNQLHITILKKYLPTLPEHSFKSIIVFTGDAEFKFNPISNVMQIDKLVSYIQHYSARKLGALDIEMTIGKLEFNRKEPSKETDKNHIQYVKSLNH